MIERRTFMAAAAGATLLAAAPAKAPKSGVFGKPRLAAEVARLERRSGGRLGVAVLDTATGARFAHRGDERFPLASTFKFLLAGATLRRVDKGLEQLDRRIAVPAASIVANSPFSKSRAGGTASVGELCEAIVTLSDNAGANLLLAPLGGPPGLTRYIRAMGDPVTRLDRFEPAMNSFSETNPRDTTTPRAMTDDLATFLLGDVLSPASRAQLLAWATATSTGPGRIRSGVPAGWTVAHKTGTSGEGDFNDVAFLKPPGRAPLLLSIYLSRSKLEWAPSEGILAAVARAVAAEV
jgi:beta-lactamase class A